MRVESILTLPDAARGEVIARAIRLELDPNGEDASRFLDLDAGFAHRNPPVLRITTPLPCDLAHAATVEFDGLPGQYPTTPVVVCSQGAGSPPGTFTFPLGPIRGIPAGAIDHPGEGRLRVQLTANPHLGWADPGVRSVWPDAITTAWCPARIVRQ